MTSRIAKCAVVFLLTIAVAPLAHAATVEWTNTSGGNWNVGSNWSTGTVPTSADDVVITSAGTYTVTLNVTATVNSLTIGGATGTQTLSIPSQTLTVTASANINPNGVLSMSGGTLAPNGAMTIDGIFNWTGGTVNGSGTVTNNNTINIAGTSVKYWYQATLNNNQTVVSSTTGYIYFYNSPVFNNGGTATWEIQSEAGYYAGSGTPVFNNSGTLTKSAGTGAKDFYFQLNNTGTVNVQSGTLRFANGGTSSGPFNVSSGATLQFYGGTHNLNAGANLTGAGSVTVTSGTANVAATYDIGTATTVSGGTLTLTGNVVSLGTLTASSGTFNLNTNTTVTALGAVTISGGALNLNSTASFTMTGLTLSNGTFGGTSAVTISGTFAWSGGTVNRTGTVTLPSGSFFNITAPTVKYWYSAMLQHSGTATSASGSYIYFYNGPVFNNLSGATWDMQTDSGYYVGSGTPVFNNAGTLTKSAGTGTKDFYFQLNNTGTVNVNSGTLRIANGGTSSGPFNVGSGATLQFYGGTHNLNAGATLTGAGSVAATGGIANVVDTYDISTATTVNGGTLNLTGNVIALGVLTASGGTFNLNTNSTVTALGAVTISGATLNLNSTAAFTMTDLALSSGTFGGSSAATISGTFAWSGGTVNRTGSVTLPTGSFFNITAATVKYWHSATLQHSGTATSASGSYIYFYNSAIISNLAGATWDMQTDSGYYVGSGTPVFNNSGTVTKSAGTGIKDFYLVFNNNGVLNVNSGTLRLANGGTSTGAYNVASGAKIQFYGGTHGLGATAPLGGAGSVQVTGGTVNVAADYNITGGTTVDGGTLNLNGTATATGPLSLSSGAFNLNTAAAFTFTTFSMTGGTFGGTAAITITTTFGWSGGTINRSGIITLPGTCTTTISGASTKYLHQVTINNSGPATSTTSAYVYLYNGAVFNNLGGATYDIQSDAGYYQGSGTLSQFNNSGTLTKSGGTGIKDFYFILNNDGQVNVQSGTLRLGNGGTSSGDFNVSSGAKLQFYAGTFSLSATVSITGAGQVQATGGTVNHAGDYDVTGALTVDGGTFNLGGTLTSIGTVTISNGTLDFSVGGTPSLTLLTLSGGTLAGTTPLTITTFNWSAGSVNRSGAIGIPAVTGALNMTGGSTKYWYQATLDNSGTVTSSSTYYTYFYNGAIINNLAGATWNMTTDLGYYFGGGALSQINNAGTMSKTAGTGVKDITIAFNNTGQVNVNSGTLRPTAGGTSSGTFNVASGATLRFAGGTHTLDASSTLTGAGTFDFNSGTVNFTGTYSVSGTLSITGGTFNLDTASAVSIPMLTQTNGTFGGSTAVTITTFNWAGGYVNRSGAVNIPASTGVLTISGGSGKYWQGATLNNSGTVNSGSTYYLYFYNGAALNNLAGATWNMTTDFGYYHGGGAMPQINNSGTMTKSGGTGSKDISITFNNNGQVNVNSGTLRITVGGTSGGTFTMAGGTTLRFAGSTNTLGASSILTGAGNVDFASGIVNFTGTYSVTGATSITGGTFNLDSASALSLATLTFSNGTLGGSTPLTITTFNWTAGTVNRSGTVNIPASTGVFTLSTGGGKYWYQATLNNSGTVNSGSTYYFYFYNGAIINNLAGATWNMTTDLGYYHGGGAVVQFNNAGTITKSGTTGSKDIAIPFNNNGQLNIDSGTLRVYGGGTSSGAFNIASGCTLRFDSATHTLDASSTVTGAGNFDVASGTVNFTGTYTVTGGTSITGGTFNIDAASPLSLPSLTFTGGTLGGSTALTITTFNWTGGTVNRSGAVNIPASTGVFTLSTGGGKYWYQATLNNSGTVNSGSTYYLYFYNGAVLNNLAGATWNMTTALGYYYGGGATSQFNNSGTVNKTTSAASKDIGIPFNNDGQVNVDTGTLRFTNGGTHTGTFNVASGATLKFDGGTHTLTGTSTVAGAGTVDAGSGTVSHAGTWNVTGATTNTGATTTLTGTISSITPLSITNGTLNINVASALTIASLTMSNGTLGGTTPLTLPSFAWSGGTVNRSGTVTIPAAATWSLTGTAGRYWYQATLDNSGTINVPMTGSVYFYNGAVVNNLTGSLIDFQSTGGWLYGGGTTPQFNNSGTLRKSGGTATQTFGLKTTNSGLVDLQIGIVSFNNGFTQSSSGQLQVTIGGTTAGTQYARATASGTATLGGALSILYNAFTPTVGDTFQVMTFGSRSGDFATKTGLTYTGGSMSYAANATDITLTGATATADLEIVKTVSSATVATGTAYTYSIDIDNLGPSGANDVTVTDTLPSGVSLNSASGTGWTCNSDGGTPPTVTCTMASLAVGAANTITLNVTSPASPQSLTNTASVTTSVGDPTSANDTSSVGVTIVSPTPGITVTSSADSGAGTLRQAIEDANAALCSAPCTIGFNLSPLQPIALASLLPAITANAIIDGTTQPGYTNTPLIEITTDGLCTCATGLDVASAGTTLRGLKIYGFGLAGVRLGGGGGHTLELSTIGDGTSPNDAGVIVASSNNLLQNNTVFSSTNNGVNVTVATGVRILGSAIHSNGGLGIDLDVDGATANDTGDSDTGANNRQNTPVISAAQATGGNLTVTLNLDSSGVAGTGSVRIEVFEADGSGQGKEYLGGACFAGNTLSSQTVSVAAPNIITGDSVVATATSYSGTGCVTVNDGTSEFSASFPVTTCTPPSADITAPSSVCFPTGGYSASAPFIGTASYTWSIVNGTIDSGLGTNAITFTPTVSSGTVDLQVIVNDGGCSTTGTAIIPINTATTPTITPDGPTTFCSGGSVTLTATGGSAYSWAPGGEVTQSIVVAAGGNYSVTVTDANGCMATSAATTVVVNPSPAVTITGPAAVCETASITLDAGPGFTSYAWLPGGEISQQIVVSPAANTTYTVTVTNASGCSASDTHDVVVDAAPVPTITASGPTTICDGNSVTLTASTGASYKWFKNDVLLPAETSIALTVTTAGDYKVEVTTAGGCANTSAPVTVTVNTPATPTITPGGSLTFCEGGNVTLTATSGNAYQWYRDSVPVSAANAVSFVADVTGNYTVDVTDANGCVATSAPIAVTVNPTPVVAIAGPTQTCASSEITLDAGAGFATYTWSTAETTRFITVTPATTTTYSVTVTDGNNCSATDSHTVTISANPIATINTAASVCAGSPNNSANVSAQPGATYTWTISNGTITAGAGTDTITYTAGSDGTITLDVTVVIGSCTSSGSTSVTINTPPSTTITGPAAVCTGGSVALDAGANFATYLWSPGGETTQAIAVTPSSTTTYSVIVTDANNCSATASHTVTVNPAPAVDITGPTATCPSSPVTLDAGAGYSTYAWSTGEQTQTITVSPSANTTYTVTVSDSNNCSASDTHTVTVNANPTAVITAPAAVCESSTGNTASVTPQPGATYAWSITGGTITAGQNTDAITFSANASGSIALDVTVNAGTCASTGSSAVAIAPPPSVTISGPASVCPNATFTLSVPNTFVSYLWSTGATTPSITISQSAASAVYTVNVTDANGCSASGSHTVAAAIADATITAPASVAANSTGNVASVAAEPGATYAWSIINGTITSPADGNSITFDAGASGAVDLLVNVTIGGCTSGDGATVAITAGAQSADFAVTKSAPASVQASASFTYTIVVTNNGPDSASGTITDAIPAGVQITNANGGAWSCSTSASQVVCSGALAASASNTILLTAIAPQNEGPITNDVSVTSSLSDPNPANNAASATTNVLPTPVTCATTPPSLLSPADNATINSPAAFQWTAVSGATSYELWLIGGGTTTLAASTSATSISLAVPSGTSSWFVVARLGSGCDPLVSAQQTFIVAEANNCAQHVAPQITSPIAGAVLNAPVAAAWTPVPEAIGYRVWIEVNGTAAQDVGTTDGAIMLSIDAPPGTIRLIVHALFGGCPNTISEAVEFQVAAPDPCANRGAASLISPVNNATLQTSSVEFVWSDVPNATSHRVWASIDGAAAAVLGETTNLSLHENIASGEVIWWVQSQFPGCASTESPRFRFVIPPQTNCSTDRPETVSPAEGATLSDANVTFDWDAVANAVGYEVYLAVANGTPALIGTTGANTTSFTGLVPPGELEWSVVANVDRCPDRESQKAHFTYAPPAECSGNVRPQLVSPLENAVIASPADFEWSSALGATRYELFIIRGTNAPVLVASTTTNGASNITLLTGDVHWFVRTHFGPGCSPLDTSEQALTIAAPPPACATLTPPVITAPGEISSGVTFTLQWTSILGATGYQLEIAANSTFASSELLTTAATSHSLVRTNTGSTPLPVFARVRAIDSDCTPPAASAFGPTFATFILPQQGTLGTVPAANPGNVQYTITLGPEFAGQTFSVTPTVSWLSASPAAGVVGPLGTDITITAFAAGLGIGANTGSVVITLNSSSGRVQSNPTTTVSTPISVNLVTPVTSAPKNTPPPDALIIPAVANADGINSHFQSDVRVSNTSPQLIKYQLTYIPTGEAGITAGRQTTFSVEPGRTVALDDILKSWFGTGTSNSQGSLEIRPITKTSTSTSSAAIGALANLVSFASSRTFNSTPNGTFGQYIPAVPFANFLGKASGDALKNVLSLQQIAQSAKYRTNLGLLEASGESASLLIKVFGGNGQPITSFPVNLNGGQHTQLNAFLWQKGITLEDGRVEVEVVSGNGKVTAYASVLDNQTSDAVLVTPVSLSDKGNTKWVVPGVADIKSGFADWQTDMRIFNADTAPAEITATFYSQNPATAPKATIFTLAAGEVKQLDKILPTLFNVSGDGGALHLSTPTAARLIATARTYNQTSTGTYGQFISAVTPLEAVGVGSRPLQLLQVEESSRFRSNIGFAETTGKPVRLEVTVTPPDAKFTARTVIDLGPNEFRQIGSMLKGILGPNDVYNARVSVRAIAGEGRATAYASVIDLKTNDPTYNPAQ
ncbi:MAG TPA: hypothetical protein VNA69_14805 [Thermoanaerobaculia bacterium]|nr:hypothetical protein [Thermoanaerobaculia bacterium]